jgi:hypothetical protein
MPEQEQLQQHIEVQDYKERVAESYTARSSAAMSDGSGFSVIAPPRLAECLHCDGAQRLRQLKSAAMFKHECAPASGEYQFPVLCFREKFADLQLSTFATQSARSRHKAFDDFQSN